MTITEKILAKHCGKKEVIPGELILAKVDLALGNDVTAPLAISEFRKSGAKRVFNRNKVVLVSDHFAPNKDILSAEQCKILRDFAREQKLVNFFEVGRMGVEHALLPEEGLIKPGMVIIGADSHTCTYGALGAFATGVGSTDLAAAMITGECWFKVPATMKFVYRGKLPKWIGGKDLILLTIGDIGVDGALYSSMEFGGDAIDNLSVEGRLTIANMVIEAGGKNGVFMVDKKTVEYLKDKVKDKWAAFKNDDNARYISVHEYDVSRLRPQVAAPHLPSNVKAVDEYKNVAVDQVVIGSCTNGRISDLRIAASILKNKKVHPYVRLIIIPATQKIYEQAMKEGLLDIFIRANAAVSTPTCGPCLGGHMGILAAGERAVATTNRNFVGRMGHPKSEVYLSGPAVAAASAVKGRITGPEEM